MSTWKWTLEASWAKQRSINEQKLTDREAIGDDLLAIWLVSHIAQFANEKSCEAATAYFASRGFETRETMHRARFALTFERHATLQRSEVEDSARDIVLVTSAHGGHYFGWTAAYVLLKSFRPTARTRPKTSAD